MIVCHLDTFTAMRKLSSKSLNKCSAGTIPTDMECVVVAVAELQPDAWPEVWRQCVTQQPWTPSQDLQEATFLDIETHVVVMAR